MIIDTTYLLPLVGVGIRSDLLRAIVERRVRIRIELEHIKLSLISLFELQAKASKLDIPPEKVARAINVILRSFTVVPFYRRDIIIYAHELRELLRNYIDRIILATAIALKEDLVTEDRDINEIKDSIRERYGINVYRYQDLVQQ